MLSVKPHPLFTRDGEHILCRVPLSFVQATLGTTLEVPTLDGRVRMKVPAGTQGGRVFRLRGKGLPSRDRGTRGDQMVTVHVEVPQNLTDEQRDLLKKFDALMGRESQPEQKSFWDKVRELFA